MAAPRFEVVEETDPPPSARPPEADKRGQADKSAGVLFFALKALSQRALIALESLFTLITIGAVFWLCMSIPDPNVHQLVGQGMFALFVLAANVIVRRK